MNNNEFYALKSLNGLWAGDCIGNLGQLYFAHDILKALEKGEMNGIKIGNINGTFNLSDDTEEGIVLYNHLVKNNGQINQDLLAKEFATRYMERDPDGEIFGYGLMTRKVLREIYEGKPWRDANKTQRRIEGPSFVDKMVSEVAQGGDIKKVIHKLQNENKKLDKTENVGSCGNGSAMRVAPLGAFLYDKTTEYIIEMAKKSAEVTHCHPEGIAGSIAVSMASALVTHYVENCNFLNEMNLLGTVEYITPDSEVKNGLKRAIELPFETPIGKAIEILGNGTHVTCQDTVPLCIWLAAKALKSYPIDKMYEEIIIETSMAFGDVDTNCAIVGGIIGTASPPPEKWTKYCQEMEDVIGLIGVNEKLLINDIPISPEQNILQSVSIKELNKKDRDGSTEYHDYESVVERYKKNGYKSGE